MSEETASTSNKRQKRCPLLPRSDLANKSPQENDADDDHGDDLKSTTTTMTMMDAAEGKPPPHPSQTEKRTKYLPVKSSGYGRPPNGIGMTSSVRPSTPVVIERRGNRLGSTTTATADSLLPPPSPSHSITSVSSRRCSTPQLRHGDGSVHRSSTSNSSNAAAFSTRPPPPRKARSASPAPSIGMMPRDNLHHKSRRTRTPSPNAAMKNDIANASPSLSTIQKQDLQLQQQMKQQQQQQHRSSPVLEQRPSKYHDYSSIDADPTPVKEARRLSSIFQNRSTATPTHHASPTITAAAAATMTSSTIQYNNLSSPLPRTPNANSNSLSKPTPLSYSKALMKGLPNKGMATLSAMKLFPSVENHHTHSEHSVIAAPTTSQTTILSAQLFSLSTGIDTPHIQHLLSNSRKGANDKWDLRKQLEQKEADLVTLRTTLQDLLAGKEQFVEGAVAIEMKLRRELTEMKRNLQSSLTNETNLREKAAEDGEKLTKNIRLLEGECEMHKTKYEVVSSELDFAKSEVRRVHDANTEHAVALALLQSKLDQSNAERDAAIERAEGAQVGKDEAVKEALAKVMSDGQSILDLKTECDDLKSRLKVRRMVEEEICKLLDVDTSLIDFTAPDAINADSAEDIGSGSMTMPFLDMVKQRLDEFQSYVVMKDDAENKWQSCVAELEQVKLDYQAAKDYANAKERDMTELMKSISDVQRSGQVREHEMANRLATAERQILEYREKILAMGYEKKSLEEALNVIKSESSAHEIAIASLRKEISDSMVGSAHHESQLQLERDMRSKAEEKASEERAERIALAAQLNAQLREHVQSEKQLRESMESMRRNMTEQINLLEHTIDIKDGEIKKCNEVIAGLEAHQLSLKKSLSEQKSILDASKEEEIGRLKGEIANLESRLTSEVRNLQSAGIASETKVQELEAIIQQGLLERKRMHNIIQELRGNVRVFARIRPFLPDDDEQECDGETQPVSHDGDSKVNVINPSNPSQRHKFSFDRVFAPSAGQEAVFSEVSEFVRSALDGYNVCLFSYGQTGSGKTHTMQGAGSGVMRGLIPRCLEQIGLHKIAEEKDGWEFTMEVSFLEIYNESLKDLLRANVSQECRHEIKVGSDGRRTVTDLTVKVIDPNDQVAVDGILALAAKRRSTASTDMNATSSRSHSVFTLNITARHVERNQVVRGTLNLVDLAGSERLDRSNATGQHAKETVAINKSLSSLVDVFTAIGQKSSHVPFRNSKLTFLLQPALSGDGKTCMIVNLSPTEASVPETLCSLRFASKVNMCELGKAKRTVEEVTTEPTATVIDKRDAAAASRCVKRKL